MNNPHLTDQAQSLTELGIAMLIDLAQKGEIDPWDVQVIDVIDRHLSKIPLESTELSESAQAILWASMLVLLKANNLEGHQNITDEVEEYIDDQEVEILQRSGLPANLERHIRRRLSAKPPEARPVTLDDLIQQLTEIAAQLTQETPQRAKIQRPTLSISKATKAIAQLAHSENLTEIAMELSQFLNQNPDSTQWLDLDSLVNQWLTTTHNDDGGDFTHHKVGVFWALLLLASQSQVELEQTEFYQTLNIRRLSP
jgi:segregation and condensation protein A